MAVTIIAGTTVNLKVNCNFELLADTIDSIIVTMISYKGKIVSKRYPGDVTLDESSIYVPLTQEDTLALVGKGEFEAQINFNNKSVAKTLQKTIYVEESNATEIIDGNTPAGQQEKDILVEIAGNLIYGRDGKDGATFTPSVSEAGVLSWTNNGGLDNPDPVSIKGERGEQGEQGEQGIPGLKGDPGISPSAKVEQTETGAVISVTDAEGTSTATVSNGKDGQPGADGEPGKDGVDRSSVYVGDSEPTDPTATLWLDPEGEGGDTSATSRFIVNVKTLDLAGYTVTASNDSGEEYTKEITEDPETVVFSFENAGIVTIKNSKNVNASAVKCGIYTAPDLAGKEIVITAQSDVILTASSQNDGNIENLYDGDTSTWWGTTDGPSCWLQIMSKNGAMIPTLLEMYPRESWTTRTPSEFVVQGSNDGGKTWEDIKSFSNQKSSLEYIPFDLSDVSNTWYRSVRVLVSSTIGSTTVVNLAEMRLTGFYNPIYTES